MQLVLTVYILSTKRFTFSMEICECKKAVSYSTPSRNTILPFSFLQIFLIPLDRLFDPLLKIIRGLITKL